MRQVCNGVKLDSEVALALLARIYILQAQSVGREPVG
jgi:hypothetical protein